MWRKIQDKNSKTAEWQDRGYRGEVGCAGVGWQGAEGRSQAHRKSQQTVLCSPAVTDVSTLQHRHSLFCRPGPCRVQQALTGVPRSCPEMKAGCSPRFTLFNQLQWHRQLNSLLHMNINSFKWQKRMKQPENGQTELQPGLSCFSLKRVYSSAWVTVMQP